MKAARGSIEFTELAVNSPGGLFLEGLTAGQCEVMGVELLALAKQLRAIDRASLELGIVSE